MVRRLFPPFNLEKKMIDPRLNPEAIHPNLAEYPLVLYPSQMLSFINHVVDMLGSSATGNELLRIYSVLEMVSLYEDGDLDGKELAEFLEMANLRGLRWKFEPHCYTSGRYWEKFVVHTAPF